MHKPVLTFLRLLGRYPGKTVFFLFVFYGCLGETRSSIFKKKRCLELSNKYVSGLTYLQVGQVLLISHLAVISFTPRNEHEKPKNVKLRMNFAKVSPSVTRRGKDSTLLLNPVRFLNYVFSCSMFSS